MEFNHFLSSYLPDRAYGGKRLLGDMVEQAKLADCLGYRGVTIPENHLINIEASDRVAGHVGDFLSRHR